MPIASFTNEISGVVRKHVTKCDMLQMNWALFNPQATIRSSIQLCLYCAVPLHRQDSLLLDTAGHPLNGAAHNHSSLQTL